MFRPSLVVKPLPQVAPPSTEYSTTVVPPSWPPVVRLASLVIRSPTVPLSLASATVGAVGAWLSRVKLKVVAVETFPARSVWRTCTLFNPSVAL